jgi:hypothetical protein
MYGILALVFWEVEYTDEFVDWWTSLSEDEQVEIAAKVELLEKHGPTLPRPHADVITSSRKYEGVAREGGRKASAGLVCV